MTTSLADQPFDIIMLILDLGGLETADAVALCLVCKELYRASEHRSFWLTIANNVQRRHPLPLPSLRPMASLSTEEIRMACVRNTSTLKNLRSSKPQCRGSLNLTIENKCGPVMYFAFLLGGRYAFVAQERGCVSIWDLHSGSNIDAEAQPVLPPNGCAPIPGGTMLAKCETRPGIRDLELRTFGPGERQTVVAIIGESTLTHTDLTILVCEFISEDEVTIHSAYETITTLNFASVALGPYGSVFMLGDRKEQSPHDGETEWSRILVIDFLRGHESLVITRTISLNIQHACDMTVTDDGDLLISRVADQTMEVFAYFDAGELIMDDPQSITLAPHAKRVITYSETCQFPDRLQGFVSFVWNTPNKRASRQLPLMTSLRPMSEDETKRRFSLHWLDLDRLVTEMKSDAPSNFLNSVHQTFCQADVQSSSVNIWPLYAFGDSARSAVWIGPPEQPGPSSLHFVPFHSPLDEPTPDKGLDLHDSIQTLELPIVLEEVTQMEFCDQSGILMIATGEGTEEEFEVPERLHFFQY